jgi:hypothetical protein
MTDHDVAVVGGGAAGVSAAVGAAAAGASVVLLESAPYLGGAATVRTVTTYCGLWSCHESPTRVVTGVADQVLAGLRALGGVSDPLTGPPHQGLPGLTVVATDPESIKHVLDDLVAAHRVELLLSATVTGVDPASDGWRVQATAFGGTPVDFTARTIVDSSGDATAAALAGVPTTGAPPGGRRQTSTLSARFGGIDPDADLSAPTIRAAVREAQQAGRTGLTSSTGFSVRIPLSHDLVAYLADEDGDPLEPRSYTAATTDARRQALGYLDVLRTLPGCANAYLVATGPELGVRESRHLVSRRPMRDADLLEGTVGPDTVALCGWPSEHHPGAGLPSVWKAVGGDGAFGIALDSLRSTGSPDVFGAGRVLTGGQLAGAAARVMGTSFATGHAAGVAAALRARGVGDDALAERCRAELADQGATLALR